MFALCCVHAGVTLAWSRTKIVALISNFSEFFTAAMLGLRDSGDTKGTCHEQRDSASPTDRRAADYRGGDCDGGVLFSVLPWLRDLPIHVEHRRGAAAHQAEPAPIRAEGEVGGNHLLVVKDPASCHSLDDRPRSL